VSHPRVVVAAAVLQGQYLVCLSHLHVGQHLLDVHVYYCMRGCPRCLPAHVLQALCVRHRGWDLSLISSLRICCWVYCRCGARCSGPSLLMCVCVCVCVCVWMSLSLWCALLCSILICVSVYIYKYVCGRMYVCVGCHSRCDARCFGVSLLMCVCVCLGV
jgi:hypothetical protein